VNTAVKDRPATVTSLSGGAPGRRAVVRWAWRLFRREWRQQLTVIGLLVVAVAAAVGGIAFAAAGPSSPSAEFGTANHMLTISGSASQQAADIAVARTRFGRIEVIEHAKAAIPGSVNTVDVRAQQPDGPYSSPMLRLDAGHYPAAGQVAVTSGVAAIYRLRIGSVWHEGGRALRVVGIVENPGNLQDEFALVAPGQLAGANQVRASQAEVLLDATGAQLRSAALPAGVGVQTRPAYNPGFPPAAVLVFDTIALLFIGLIAVAGFTVLAQRRLRALGMLQAVGATDRHVRLVLIANGAVVGIVAAVTGAVAALAGWAAFVPRLETIVEHRIAMLSLPWWEVAAAVAMTVVTAVAAAWWPARAAAHVPVVAALSGRPASPKQGRRSAALGGALLAIGLTTIALSHEGKTPPLIIGGLILTSVGVLLLGPIAIGALAVVGRRAPLAIRLALRDLARYRARSGSALAAITLVTGIVAAIAISAAAAAQNEGLSGEAGWANLPANQLMVYLSPGGSSNLPEILPQLSASRLHRLEDLVGGFARTLHSQDVVPLDAAESAGSALAQINQVSGVPTAALGATVPGPGGRLQGVNAEAQLYVATPTLLRFYGVDPAAIAPGTEVITSRTGLSGTKIMDFGPATISRCPAGRPHCAAPKKAPGGGHSQAINLALSSPSIQVLGLAKYASAPNTLLTAHAMAVLGFHPVLAAWLIQTPKALTAAQVTNADHWAASNGLTVETTSHSAQAGLQSVSDWAIAVGVLAVLAVLAMTVGLIRSETAGDLRVLSATGASGSTRRLLTGATAGALALLGAVLGTAAAYLGIIAWNRGLHSLTAVPAAKLAMLIVGLPLLALVAAWLLAGREPPAIAQQPLE
jgi:putative ABC transport system permease protein